MLWSAVQVKKISTELNKNFYNKNLQRRVRYIAKISQYVVKASTECTDTYILPR